MDYQLLAIYCFTIFVASIIPGPSSLLALTQGARYGLVAGLLSALGNVAASVLQGVVALALILQLGQVSATGLYVAKLLGAAYIIYLGLTLLRVESFGTTPYSNGQAEAVPAGKHLWDGFAFAVFNPKALTFFAALFPQFVGDGRLTVAAAVAIFLPVAVIAFACFMAYVAAGRALVRLMSRTRHIGKILGGAIIMAGVALLWS